jgi:hypothetical protein
MTNKTVHSRSKLPTRDYQSGILDALCDVSVNGVQCFSYL